MSGAKAVEIIPPVTLTDAAQRHVLTQLEKRGSGVGVRLGVKKMGCSGFGYEVDFIDQPGAGDHVFPVSDAVAVYVNPQDLPYVKGTRIDYVREGLNATFKFINPNAQDTCGCGESFSVSQVSGG